jgi:hypothetical protein
MGEGILIAWIIYQRVVRKVDFNIKRHGLTNEDVMVGVANHGRDS